MDRRGEDLELLYEKCDWPTEFLRDPSCWLEADKMEALLRQIEMDYGQDSLIINVGHQCKDLRSWGVLDSVLRMVQASKDLFAQPERFLSYFVSPAPPIGELRRGADSVSFVLPVSEVQFPLVTTYLRAALEALPTYISKPMANVTWLESRVQISWSERQVSLFSDAQNTELSLHPELVRNILMNLESSQTELEQAKKNLLDKDHEIERLKKALSKKMSHQAMQTTFTERKGVGESSPLGATLAASSPAEPVKADLRVFGDARRGDFSVRDRDRAASTDDAASDVDLSALARALGQEIGRPVANLLNELYRAGDYMARGQQLITLLIGQGRQTPQVQEAMRRVDWPFVAAEGPLLIKRVISALQGLQETSHDLSALADLKRAQNTQTSDALLGQRVPSDLNHLVERAIANVSARESKLQGGQVQIDRSLALDRHVPVLPTRIEQAVTHLISNSLESVQEGGLIRISTRPKGTRAEIEISDNGQGWSDASIAWFNAPVSESADLLFTPSSSSAPRLGLALAQSIIRLHDGSIHVVMNEAPKNAAGESGDVRGRGDTGSMRHGATITVDLPLL